MTTETLPSKPSLLGRKLLPGVIVATMVLIAIMVLSAILLLDFILGYNASMDPVDELLDAILEAKQIAPKCGGNLTVVASICGTDGDPQDLNLQIKLLKEAGAIVFHSNARAASFCCELLK